MNFLEPITLGGLSALIFPFCRISGFLASFFAISGSTVPMMVRALLAVAFTVCVLPSVPAPPEGLYPFSVAGLITVFEEVLKGLAIGYMTQLIAQIFAMAGQAIAMQTGLGFASLVDPVSGTNAPVVGQFFTILSILVFFALNGHIAFFGLMLMSFETLPIGSGFLPQNGLYDMALFGSFMFEGAVAMALSAICTMLIVNFTVGVMTRAAPQLNIFSLGFAVSMIVGLVVLVLSMNAFMGNFTADFNEVVSRTCTLVGTSCDGLIGP